METAFFAKGVAWWWLTQIENGFVSSAPLDEAEEVSICLSNSERDCLISKIRVANRFHLRILTEIPKSLRRLWSDCTAATLMKFTKAKTDDDSFWPLESWVKLKSVLVPMVVRKAFFLKTPKKTKKTPQKNTKKKTPILEN